MFKALYLIFAVLVSFQTIFCQSEPGARQTAMGKADAALSDDAFAVFNNPAGLSQIEWREAAFFYSPSPFGLKELSSTFAAYNEPMGPISIGAGFMTYGFEMYHENRFSLAFSSKYRSVHLGAAINYQSVSILNYGKDGAVFLNLGALILLTKESSWGFSVNNITQASVGNEAGQLPYGFSTGFAFRPSEGMTLIISGVKTDGIPYDFRGGLEYCPVSFLALRSGFAALTDRFSAGFGIIYKMFRFDYAVFTHDDLGLTHQIGLLISFSGEKSLQAETTEMRGSGGD